MCRAGGPRCDGKGRRSKANTTNTEASGGTATAVDERRRLTRDGFVAGGPVGQGVGLSSCVQQGNRVGVVVGLDIDTNGASRLDVAWLPDSNTSQAARSRAMAAVARGEHHSESVAAEGLIALDAYLPDK